MKRTIIPSTYISYNPSIVLPTNCKICFEAELPEKHPSLGIGLWRKLYWTGIAKGRKFGNHSGKSMKVKEWLAKMTYRLQWTLEEGLGRWVSF